MSSFTNSELYKLGKFDSAGRWFPNQEVAVYFNSIRHPSRAWPLSYWKAAKTLKFYKWCVEKGIANAKVESV